MRLTCDSAIVERVELVIAVPMLSFIAGLVGLIVALQTPRAQRGPWLWISIAMVAAGLLGVAGVFAIAFG